MSRVKKTMICPFGGVGVGGKWKLWIWYYLLDGSRRFGELQRLIPEASRQMLTMQLREMEQMGFVHRQVYDQASPKVEYSLTELAQCLEPIVRQVYTWSEWYGQQTGLGSDWLVSLGGRWKFWIWYHLLGGNKRFGELQQLIPGANRQTLTLQLRALEQMGVLRRQATEQGSTRTEYALTEPAQQSGPMLLEMFAWGKWACNQLGVEFDWPVNDEAEERIGQRRSTGQLTAQIGTYALS